MKKGQFIHPLRMNRRQFLNQSMMLAAVSALANVGYLENSNAEEIVYDCIVLGGGFAGVTAARDLVAPLSCEKSHNVLLLEGSDRLGGRVQTLRNYFPDHVELGAEFIHRRPGGAALWEDVYRYDMGVKTFNNTSNIEVWYPGWEKMKSPTSVAMSDWGIGNAMGFQGADYLDQIKETGRDMTPVEYLKGKTGIPYDFPMAAFMGCMPAERNTLSLKGFGSDKMNQMLMEEEEHYIKAGYQSFAEKVAGKLNVKFNHFVERIKYSADGVEISCSNRKTYKAKSAICSFSLGMLKSGDVEFAPGLPNLKKEAIKTIQFGEISKYVIQFKECFWNDKVSMFIRPDQKRKAGLTYFNYLHRDNLKGHYLTALLVGEDALKMRKYSKDEALKVICADLEEMYPEAGDIYSKVVVKSDGSHSTYWKQWLDDPFSKGADSFLRISQSEDVIQDLTKLREIYADASETPSLFWAGEGTSVVTQPQSTHGAHLSGKRAALQVRRYLTNGEVMSISEGKEHFKRYSKPPVNPKSQGGGKKGIQGALDADNYEEKLKRKVKEQLEDVKYCGSDIKKKRSKKKKGGFNGRI